MLASYMYKNLCCVKLRHFGGSIAYLSSFVVGSDSACSERHKSLRILGKPIFPQHRRYSSETGVLLPPISDFPIVLWPAMLKTLHNAFFINMVVRPQCDREFDIAEFLSASKQALFVVSNALAREDYDLLDGLVTNDAIQSLRQKISSLTDQQKQLISVQSEDTYMTFPYEVGIMQEGERGQQRIFVEITVVHHILRGLTQMKEAGELPPLNMGLMPEYRERIFVANYRFIREYTKNVDSPWIINMVNHFMPMAIMSHQLYTNKRR